MYEKISLCAYMYREGTVVRPRFWPHVYVAPMSLLASCLRYYCPNDKKTMLLVLLVVIRITTTRIRFEIIELLMLFLLLLLLLV